MEGAVTVSVVESKMGNGLDSAIRSKRLPLWPKKPVNLFHTASIVLSKEMRVCPSPPCSYCLALVR